MKNYTKEKWEECLSTKDWSQISDVTELEDKVKVYNRMITEALDEVAPIKTFKVKSQYKFGISDSTKVLMAKRDDTRKKIKNSSAANKQVMMNQYRKLRNKVKLFVKTLPV